MSTELEAMHEATMARVRDLGPWRFEPNRIEFRSSGLPCLMNRNSFGAWCGYAAVPPGHPCHGLRYDAPELSEIRVHGGLTFSGGCEGHICHVPKPGEPDDVHWFGFDCSHVFDLAPSHLSFPKPIQELLKDQSVYRSVGYVRRHVKHLAYQLACMGGRPSASPRARPEGFVSRARATPG